MEVQYEEQLTATLEANHQCRTAHQAEVQKLISTINQMREQQKSSHTDCERRVEESYTRGWHEVEVQYEQHLESSMEAMAQARAAHENEIQKLTAVINQVREQKDETHIDCERRLMEFHSTGLRQTDAMSHKQIDQVERQLSASKISAQLRVDYLLEQKVRLERENREIYHSLSRTQRLLLETQRELTTARAQLEARWMPHRLRVGAQAWGSFLAERVKFAWDSFGKERWKRYGAPLRQLARIVRVKFEIHAFLMAGLVVDVTKTIYTELRLFIRDLPETLPQAVEDIRKTFDFARLEATNLLYGASQYLWGEAVAATKAVHAKITPTFQKFVQELHLEELEPHIQVVKRQVIAFDKSMSPYLEQVNRSVENLKNYFVGLFQRIKQYSFEIMNRVYTYARDRMRSLNDRKDELVKDFGLAARTVFLVLQVYDAPKFILDPVAHCHEQPEAALWTILKFSLVLTGLWLVRPLAFPVKRKRLPHRKVKFATT
eukprot:scaffold3821_cov173-Amphora_coffeaeformis.AAC.20